MPRQKKTAPAKDYAEIAEDLPDLTANQMAYVRALLNGKNKSDAYRAAYDTSNWTEEAVWVEACRLSQNPKVLLWLHAARTAAMDSSTTTIENHREQLTRLREIAIASGNVGAAVLAETNKGKADGLYTERVELTQGSVSGAELLSRLAKLSPEAARALAKDLGLEPPV